MAAYKPIVIDDTMDAFQYTADATVPEWFTTAVDTGAIMLCPILSAVDEDGKSKRLPDLITNLPFGQPNTCKENDWVAQITDADGKETYKFFGETYFPKHFEWVAQITDADDPDDPDGQA